MSKVTSKQKQGALIITNKLSYPEAVNMHELDYIAAGKMTGLFPVSLQKKKRSDCLGCQVGGMISLKTYFGGIVSKKTFLDTVANITELLKACEKHNMKINNLHMEADYIFIEPHRKAVRMIMWPVVNNHLDRHPAEFLREMPYTISFNKTDSLDYVTEYLKFFGGHNPFSLNAFCEFIRGLAGGETKEARSEKLENTRYGGGNSGLPTTKEIGYRPGDSRPPSRSGNKSKDDTTVLWPPGSAHMSSGTTVLGEDSAYATASGLAPGRAYPYLERLRTGERISIDKPCFRIGKERSYADFHISHNNAVSRSHADIITRAERFYIIDRNSSNKTRIYGGIIAPETEVEIYPGTKIRLADEEFLFGI